MKIDVGSIAGVNGKKLGFSFSVSSEQLGYYDDDMQAVSEIAVEGDVTNESETFIVSGNIAFAARGVCARCLKQCVNNYCFDFSERFEYEPEEEFLKIRDNTADISEAVLQNILANSPSKILCKDDCQGLCPQCGSDLNEKSCSCNDNKINPQFSKLAELLKK